MNDIPLIQAAKLWQKTSASGRTYLTGRMGGLRVLVFENGRRTDEADPTHFLMIGAADPDGPRKPATAAPEREPTMAGPSAGPSLPAPAAAAPERPPQRRRVAVRAPAGRKLNREMADAIDGDGFDWDRGDDDLGF